MKLHNTIFGMKLLAFLLPFTLAATGCAPFSPSPRQTAPAPLPSTYVLYSETPSAPHKWWEVFGSEELNELVEEAVSKNFDIAAAWARLRQARAAAVQAGAAQYPTLDATGDYSHVRKGQDAAGGGRSVTTTETTSIGLSAGYELDLWNRIGSAAMAKSLSAQASREDVSTAATTVAGEVVSHWLQIQEQRRIKAILEEQIATNQTYLELIELRYRNALSTALDVYQQRETVAKVMAELPPVESSEQVLLHELALLLGRPAGTVEIATADLPGLPELPSLGLPVDLLANRPDVRSAGLALRSADWSVAAARADRLPTFNLTGEALYSGSQLATLFDNWMLSLAASVVGPIFDGGYRTAVVDEARGVVDERLAEYKETVYTAFLEVQNALVKEKWQKQYLTARQNQLRAARISLDEAISRYTQGLDDYLPVLDALDTVQNLEVSQVEDTVNLLLDRVGLYRALGGAWTDDLPNPEAVPPVESHPVSVHSNSKGQARSAVDGGKG